MARDSFVDGYCERVAPGLFGEPLNAISNAAFLIVAVLLWFMVRPAGRTAAGSARSVYALPILIGLIFLGSTAFHTTATRWGAALDVGFIAVFQLYYVVFFVHHFGGVRWRLAWLGAPVFLAFAVVVAVTVGMRTGGPSVYLAALLGLFALAVWLRLTNRAWGRPYWRWFAAAGMVFTVSLVLRTLDHVVCGSFPAGTHFLWHVLNAVTLYLVAAAGIARWRENTDRELAPRG